MAKRLADGIMTGLLLVALPLAGAVDRLAHPAPWIGFAAVVILLLSQPHLGSKEMVAKAPDEYSALAIYIAMMGSMVGGIAEYGYRAEWRPAPVSAAVAAGLLVVALVTVLAIPAYLHRIRVEERTLNAELGEPYRAYASRTRRLIPLVV